MSVNLRADAVELVDPSLDLRDAWLDCRTEWGPGLHEDGFGLTAVDEVDTTGGFSDWIDRLRSDVDCTYRWILEGGRVLGGIALRHVGHESADRLGHIGYGVRPSDRGRGIATWALGRMLDLASQTNSSHVVAICEADNVASIATLERAGGVRFDVDGSSCHENRVHSTALTAVQCTRFGSPATVGPSTLARRRGSP